MKYYYIVSGQGYRVLASSEDEAQARLNQANYTPYGHEFVEEWEVATVVWDTEDIPE